MEIVQAPPVAKRLITGLRELGYDFATAVADLVDNSLAADATVIRVDLVPRKGNVPAYLTIADDGKGIPREQLIDAMRFGGQDEHAAEDLGKYGLGLKTASLSQARVLTVASRAQAIAKKKQRHIARWDLHALKDKWDLQFLDDPDLKNWERNALDVECASEHGTVVLWSSFESHDALDSEDARTREAELADLTDAVTQHLGMVFHRFLQGVVPKRRKAEIWVCGVRLQPWDPFCRNERTKELPLKTFVLPTDERGSAEVTLAGYVLPAQHEFSSPQAHEAAGRGEWNQRQGLYFYRNNRLLQAGGWSRLRAPDEHTKLLRVAVDFPGNLDRAFNINVSKMRARVPSALREQFRNLVGGWAKTARARYDQVDTPDDEPTFSNGKAWKPPPAKRDQTVLSFGGVTVTASRKDKEAVAVTSDGLVRLTLPEEHDVFEQSKDSLEAFAAMLVELLAAVAEHRMTAEQLPVKSLRKKLAALT